jgi:hypothetical protein
MLTAVPTLQLIRPGSVVVSAGRQSGRALVALLSLLAKDAQERPQLAGLQLDVSDFPWVGDTCSLCEMLEAACEPLHAFSGLVSGAVPLGPAERVEGLLRTALPNVERFMTCRRCGALEQQELLALASGLPSWCADA